MPRVEAREGGKGHSRVVKVAGGGWGGGGGSKSSRGGPGVISVERSRNKIMIAVVQRAASAR